MSDERNNPASGCDHDCGSCSESCGERDPKSLLEKPLDSTDVKKVIAVVSGKGGVGKSLVTGMCAVMSQRAGYKCGVLDADITGPSIPKMFGSEAQAAANSEGLLPNVSKTGIKLMSANLVLENPEDPVLWRGPLIAGLVKQFWSDVVWGDLDFLFVDMPPGTGDVPLTVFQSLPVDGIVIVASPQELVGMIVEKAVNMAAMMKVPVIGIVENMSYVECPKCGEEIKIFGGSHVQEVADDYGIDLLGRIPIEPSLATACDRGLIELFEGDWLDGLAGELGKML